jgi:hypothetical protein
MEFLFHPDPAGATCRLAKARPDPDFRYLSKRAALDSPGTSRATMTTQGEKDCFRFATRIRIERRCRACESMHHRARHRELPRIWVGGAAEYADGALRTLGYVRAK